MHDLLTLIRSVIAVILPLGALILSIICVVRMQKTSQSPQRILKCANCRKERSGENGAFYYQATRSGKKTGTDAKKSPQVDIFKTDSRFICQTCAKRYILLELLQSVGLSLAYPLYLFVIVPLVAPGAFIGFLGDLVTILLGLSAIFSIYKLLRAALDAEGILAFASDEVAIKVRRFDLGRHYDFYTRLAARLLALDKNKTR